MKKVCASLCLLLLAYASASAGVIKGKVVDDLKEALEFVNVAVYQKGSATPHKGSITDATGHFAIDGVKDGTYVVKFSFMGYEEQQRTVTLDGSNSHTANLHTVTMSEDRAVLQEVSVSTQKAAMRLDIDKKVFDVSQNIATAGLSASEALENIPSVEVDQEGNISLRGSESVTIWINGKAQGLTSDNRGDILQQLPAESIERIEVITNPSSKYSPEGSAGIINIILKRDRKAGYYGGVQLNMGKGKDQDPHGRLGANINYSSGILEAYANIGLGRRVRSGHGFTDRDDIDSTSQKPINYTNTRTTGSGKGTNFFGRAGLTWHITQKDEVSVGYMGMLGLGKGHNDSRVETFQGYYPDMESYPLFRPHSNVPSEYFSVRNNYSSNQPHMNTVNVGYKHEWKTNHTLEATLSYNRWKGTNETGHEQVYDSLHFLGQVPMRYADMAQMPGAVTTQEWQEGDMNNHHMEFQLDYEQPLGAKGKLETGYKATWGHENSPQETWSSLDKAPGTENPTLYNRFIYDQTIHAAYFNYQNRWGKLGYQVGLRGEYWTVDTQSKNYNEDRGTSIEGLEKVPDFKKDFFKLFPTVFLSYEMPAHQELQLNYTRRLQRPWGGQLNSFKRIDNPQYISFGNPELTPTYTNSFELNYLKNWDEHTLSVSGYYRPTEDVMQRISFKRDGVIYTTSENLTKEVSSGLEVISKNKLFRIIDLTTTVNAFYYKLDGGTFIINQRDTVNIKGDEDFSWNATMMAQVTLPWQLAFQATGRYNAARVIAQGKRDANFGLDLGLRRAFFDKKLTVNFNVRNALDSRKFRARTHTNNYAQLQENVWGSRRFGIQIAYTFGNMAGKPRKPGERGGGEGMEGGSEMENTNSGGFGMGED
ncbi:MAG: TonB-dependent receptor [Bacteroidales bacterium]|nr:TonB-dependent receptor [Bacteroidales bacterium]